MRKKRLDLKLLQRDVARKLGVDETSVHNWERNLTSPSIAFIPGILNFLGYIPFDMEAASLGGKIRTYRRTLGLTQKALAKRLKIDPSTLARWEKGRGRPSERLLEIVGFFASLNQIQCPMRLM